MRELTDIINWRRISEHVTLSGQPTEDQLSEIKSLGVSHVINLGPHDNKGALDDEAGVVAGLGMEYHYIPVDFNAPTDADFEAFCSVYDGLKVRPVHVHCIYNARVSAFMYRYANEGRGGDAQESFERMDSIWRPGGVWATFIRDDASVGLANRYAGEDY